jgi:hypothetical protein
LKVSALVVDGVLGIFVKPWLICRHVCSCGWGWTIFAPVGCGMFQFLPHGSKLF